MVVNGMNSFTKIIRNKDLYNATEEEILDLENSIDPTVRRETGDIWRPLFEDVQKEKKEAKQFTGEFIIREVEENDFEELIRFSRKVNWLDDETHIRSFTIADLRTIENQGVIFIVTTSSGYIIGTSCMLVGDYRGRKAGYEFTMMVSKLFRRKGVGEKLFERKIEWAWENNVTHINTRGLSEYGVRFLEAMKRKRRDLEFVINEYGTSSIIIKRI